MTTEQRLFRIISDCNYLAKELIDAGDPLLASKVLLTAGEFQERPRIYGAPRRPAVFH